MLMMMDGNGMINISDWIDNISLIFNAAVSDLGMGLFLILTTHRFRKAHRHT